MGAKISRFPLTNLSWRRNTLPEFGESDGRRTDPLTSSAGRRGAFCQQSLADDPPTPGPGLVPQSGPFGTAGFWRSFDWAPASFAASPMWQVVPSSSLGFHLCSTYPRSQLPEDISGSADVQDSAHSVGSLEYSILASVILMSGPSLYTTLSSLIVNASSSALLLIEVEDVGWKEGRLPTNVGEGFLHVLHNEPPPIDWPNSEHCFKHGIWHVNVQTFRLL